MIKNYFSLCYLTSELRQLFFDGMIHEIYTHHKNELCIILSTSLDERYCLKFITNHSKLALSLSKYEEQQRGKVVSLFTELQYAMIDDIIMSPSERIIYFKIQKYKLAFQCFSADTNVFLLNAFYEIERSFKDEKKYKGIVFTEKNTTHIIDNITNVLSSFSSFNNALISSNQIRIERKISQVLVGFDMHVARELLFRLNEGEKNTHSDTIDAEAMYQVAKDIFQECLSPIPQIYEDTNFIEFSIISLHQYKNFSRKTYARMVEAIEYYSSRIFYTEHFIREKQIVQKNIEKAIRHCNDELYSLEKSFHEISVTPYKHYGDLLMTNSAMEFSSSKLHVFDYTSNEEITIRINPKQSLIENANAYYQKSKDAKQKIEFIKKKKEQCELLCEIQRAALEKLIEVTTSKEFKKWKQDHKEILKNAVTKEDGKQHEQFRTFKLSNTVTLYVGKNAKNNEVLSFKFGKPNDYWLHARGCGGSHCIVKGNPSRKELEEACSIAAYYSEARGSEFVPVICVLKKYVRKSKSGGLGAVIIDKEKVLIVPPKKPAIFFED